MRDVTDTFHRSPVILRRPSGEETELLAGVIPVDAGGDGEVNGEMDARQERTETAERLLVSFNRESLAEQGLIDPDTDAPLIDPDGDRIVMADKRYSILTLTDRAVFRGQPILVRLMVVR